MKIDLTGKVTMITAGATKAGRQMAYEFAKSGSDMVITYLPFQKEAAGVTKAEIEKIGTRCLALEVNLREISKFEEVINQVDKEFGRLDTLIFNAGTDHVVPFEELTEEMWDDSNDVMAKSVAFLGREAAKLMMKHEHGRMIFMGGNSYYENDPKCVGHGNAKFGGCKVMTALAVQYTPYIQCNAVNMNMCYPCEESDFSKRETDYGQAMDVLGGIYEYHGRKWRCLDMKGVSEFLIFLAGCSDSCCINGAMIPMDCGMGLDTYRFM